MLMLSVFRNGTLQGQAELTGQGLRIGRGSENDIVLEDAVKRVSRLHAELRLDPDGSVTLTDLHSANGTWIAGERVASEALEPGVPFTIGPYRLMLEEFADGAAAEPPERLDDSNTAWSALPPPGATLRRMGDAIRTGSMFRVNHDSPLGMAFVAIGVCVLPIVSLGLFAPPALTFALGAACLAMSVVVLLFDLIVASFAALRIYRTLRSHVDQTHRG
jgi:hypothetical protein